MKRLLIAATLVSLTATAGVNGQGFPTPKPTDAHKLLWKDQGTWDCEVKMFVQGPTGPPLVGKGVEINKLVSGKMYVKSSFECNLGGTVFEGHGLMGYHAKSKKYQGTWADNFTSSPTHMVGNYDKSGKTFTIRSTVLDDAGNELKQKQVTTFKDDKNKHFVIFLVVDAGGKEMDVKLFEMNCKRRK